MNSPSEYFSDPTNFFNILPLYTVLQSVIRSFWIPEPPKDGESIHLFYATCTVVGIFCLWQNLFMYLRMLKETGYLARMITEVIKETRIFFLIYMISHMAFA